MIYLISALIGSIITYAILIAKNEDMLLYKYGQLIDGIFWLKPFGGCGHCTTFWVAIIAYLSLSFGILVVPLLVLTTACLSVTLLQKLFL